MLFSRVCFLNRPENRVKKAAKEGIKINAFKSDKEYMLNEEVSSENIRNLIRISQANIKSKYMKKYKRTLFVCCIMSLNKDLCLSTISAPFLLSK